MNKKISKLSVSIGSIAAVAAPVAAVISCGGDEKAAAKGTGTGTTQNNNQQEVKSNRIWDVFNSEGTYNGVEDNTPIQHADMSALHYIINDEDVDTELNALTNHGRVAQAAATKIAAGARSIIQYYTDANFANTRVEIEVVEQVKNVFKIKNTDKSAEEKYTNENRKVDVYGYEVVGTGNNNKLKLIGSSAVALAHAFYLYVKQNEYGLIDWANARGGEWNTEHHSVNDFKHSGNTLVIPGTEKGRAFGNGEELKAATRVVARSPYQKHWFNNNVTSAYTMAYWDKSQWEAQLNWLAVHGYDLILDPIGTEAVQFNVWKKLLYPNATEEEAYSHLNKFFTGPTFESWQRKGNITNYDTPREYAVFKAWNDKQVELERFIKAKAAEKGIETSAQGFSGFVPTASAGQTMHFGNKTVSYRSEDLYETHWGGAWGEEHISTTSVETPEVGNSHFGHMLDPSIVANDGTTAYQLIGNEIVKEYERLILDGGKQKYINEDPFDEMHPMRNHADGTVYANDLYNTSGFTGKRAFLSDLGYGLSKAALGIGDGTDRIVTNIAWQYTYMRADWDRQSFQDIIVGHDRQHPNFTPENHLVVSLGEDWDRYTSYGMDGKNVVKSGMNGFDANRDGYDFAFYGGFQGYDFKNIPADASDADKADATRGGHFDIENPGLGGASFVYTPIVCLGSGNIPGGELGYYASGLSDVFYNINAFPGGKANSKGKRPLLDNFMAYGPGMEGFEQNEILYETLSDMGWRQDPFNIPSWQKPDGEAYKTEGSTHAIFKAYLANYAANRYNFNDQKMADFLFETTRPGGSYSVSTGNPRHTFEATFANGNVWTTGRGGNWTKVSQDYETFKEVINRHRNDEHKSQLLEDDLALYTMDYLGMKFDNTLKELKQFIDNNSNEIAILGSPARAQFTEYKQLVQWYYDTLDRVMADTTLWRLDRWVNFAREWGDDTATKAWYEADAKRLLSVWGPDVISDYAARAWQGLIKYQGQSRMHALDLIEAGYDPISWQPHAQYLWSEENFEVPALPEEWFAKPFEHQFEKNLELLTLASKIDTKGVVTGVAQAVQGVGNDISLSGASSKFTSTDQNTGGINTPISMNKLNDLKGKFVKLELNVNGQVHINKIYYNDTSNVNKLLVNVNKDLSKGQSIIVQIPADFEFAGGNNGDLSIVIDGVAATGVALPTTVSIKVTPLTTAEALKHAQDLKAELARIRTVYIGEIHDLQSELAANNYDAGYVYGKLTSIIGPADARIHASTDAHEIQAIAEKAIADIREDAKSHVPAAAE